MKANPILLAYVLSLALGIFFALFSLKETSDVHREDILRSVKSSLDNSVESFERISDFVFKEYFSQEVKEKIYVANFGPIEERQKIREWILNKLGPVYPILKGLGIKQFHIHLADNFTSFVRFHKPDLWGDSLKGVRKTVELCLEEGKEIHGFEEGRIFSGFRNVYPIVFNGKVVGSVEISVALNAVAFQALMDKDRDFAKFILRRDLVEKKVFQQERLINYKLSSLSRDFYEDVSDIEVSWFKERAEVKSKISEIDSILREKIKTKLPKFKPFQETIFYKDTSMIVSFIPIKEINGDPAGYFVYYKEDRHWKHFLLAVSFFLGFFIIVHSTLFIFIYKLQKKITLAERTDSLTGTLIRREGIGRLRSNIDREKREKHLSLLFIDVDNFKRINDTYGHDTGDRVLKRIAQIIKKRLRKSDFVFRYGGEEFVVVLPDTDIKGARKLAEDIRALVEEEDFGIEGKVTVSIGVVERRDQESVEKLIDRADKAMYRAKKAGKNRVETDEG